MIGNGFLEFSVFVVFSNALALAARWAFHSRQTRVIYVGQVEKLLVYPIKSCSGLEAKTVYCKATGLEYLRYIQDRHFVLVIKSKNSEPYKVLTQRQCPRLALVNVGAVKTREFDSSCKSGEDSAPIIRISAPDMPVLDIQLPLVHQSLSGTRNIVVARLWGRLIYGRDCGPNASSWWNVFLGRDDIVMMHCDSDSHRSFLVDSADKMPAEIQDRLKNTDETAYADWAPLLIANTASIDDLNTRLHEKACEPVNHLNFRPNILIRATQPFCEDNFDLFYIGPADDLLGDHVKEGLLDDNKRKRVIDRASVVLRQVKPCTRCIFTTVDPKKAEKRSDGEPLKTLKLFRSDSRFPNSPLFGVNAAPDRTGCLNEGDAVFASYM